MTIKVLHIIDHLGYGGAPVAVKNMAERVDGSQIEATVCSLRTNPQAIPIKTRLINMGHHKYNPFTFLAIAKLCKEHKIDIVHAHLQKSVMSCLLASFFCKSKIIIHEHGPIFRGGTGFIYRLFLRAFGSRAATAIANSQATKDALSRVTGLSGDSICVVSNFIDFAQFDYTLYDREKTRKNLGITGNEIVVGFVGRLDHCKGADILINAASILGNKTEYRFIIVGDGAQRQELEKLTHKSGLENNVTFMGLYKNPAELIVAFDMAVVPSRREAFGIAAVELMRMRVPVIASAVGGLTEIIQHEKTGILLDTLNAECIADSIHVLANDSLLRGNLAENAEEFSKRFDGREQIGQITKIYKNLCS